MKDPHKINLAAYPSTLDRASVLRLPVYRIPDTYHTGTSGMGCAGDPPGFPTYFVQPVYNRHGSTPHKAPTAVLMGPDGKLRIMPEDRATWRRLYVPLPVEHERVVCWIADTFAHFRNCYRDAERPEYGRPGTLIFPVPSYKLKPFVDDPRWPDTYRAAHKAEVDAFNAEECARAERIATVENHRGVVLVRETYPDFEPTAEQINNPVEFGQADWWTTDEARPTAGTCRGDYWNMHPQSGRCRWCGHGEG